MANQNKDVTFLIEDVYKMVERGHKPSEVNLNLFTEGVKEALTKALTQGCTNKDPYLRLSSVGTPDRKLWFTLKKPYRQTSIKPSQAISFMYGHIIEQFILFLVREAGYEVTDEQKQVEIEGVKGHLDCKINGFLIDVKGMSGFNSPKMDSAASLAAKDEYGYIAQLSSYAQAEGVDSAGFLVFNKENGTLTLCLLSEFDLIDAKKRVIHIKNMLQSATPPERCYEPIKDKENGNMVLSKQCAWCPFKVECYADVNEGQGLRAFRYTKGSSYELKYFTKVVKKPIVPEIKIVYEKEDNS